MLQQGLELLVYGMGTVIVFLGLLVLATRVMSAVALRWFATPASETQDSAPPATAGAPSPQLLAAIAAAVHRYRQEQGRRSP